MNEITLLIRLLDALVRGEGKVIFKQPTTKEWHVVYRVSYKADKGYMLERYEPRVGTSFHRGMQGWEFVSIAVADTAERLLPSLDKYVADLDLPIWETFLPDHTMKSEEK